MSVMSPLFLRCPQLRRQVEQDADPGPSQKALILIGLLASGRDRQELEAVYYQALAGRLAPDVRQALLNAWQAGQSSQSDAHDAVASTMLAPCLQPASTTPREYVADLWSIGMEV